MQNLNWEVKPRFHEGEIDTFIKGINTKKFKEAVTWIKRKKTITIHDYTEGLNIASTVYDEEGVEFVIFMDRRGAIGDDTIKIRIYSGFVSKNTKFDRMKHLKINVFSLRNRQVVKEVVEIDFIKSIKNPNSFFTRVEGYSGNEYVIAYIATI